ncbi:tRNA epoxyqueuosine(34) reductase QueG [Calycomorphotria hydatis]|uniref:Epoxyqueuosine reductase n=1 Tax=Calycomorphotria hydatis TaxID=2528027 RepID=A0A517TCJ2_9PLAN|nr:tRNA epoxyqueuosine(34) reductase QueG [Calycomorphotria hydatis]QDT66088.1 Epoxyqueuosine reductase [Calycomorphotria hydatis]
MTNPSHNLTAPLKREAYRLGFDLCGIAPAVTPPGYDHFLEWLDRGHAGEMHYLEHRKEARKHPESVMPDVNSVIMVGLNYETEEPPKDIPPGTARVSRYAWGEADYHDIIKQQLKKLADFLHAEAPGCHTRPVVDTAPLLERDFAQLAGLGWFGKNTMLINKWIGSYFFLGALLTDLELDYDEPHHTTHCGTCTACLDACPTDAFNAPHDLDARKCISYLTIELKDHIPEELSAGTGDWLFGCDICQAVCPWTRHRPGADTLTLGRRGFSEQCEEMEREDLSGHFVPTADLNPADCVELLKLTPEQFKARFKHSPLSRPKRAGLLRNAAIVLGNTGNESHLPILESAAQDKEELVSEAAKWAINKVKSRNTILLPLGEATEDE